MSYIGKAAQLQGAYDKADIITFNGTVGPYDILVGGVPRAVGKATNLIVFVNNVYFKPITDYNVSGSTITFTSAQAAQPNQSIVILGDVFMAPSVVATNLDSLTDVVAGSPAVNDILKWNGSNWINSTQGTYVISNNTDVNTAGAASGNKLVYNGTTWVPEADTLDNIDNVNAPSPINNQVLTWNAATSNWIAQNPASTVVAINDLSDVDTSTPPNNNQVLTWVAASNQWMPVSLPTIPTNINSLSDVDTASFPPTNGQVLIWNSSTSQWSPGSVESASVNVSLDNLTDVTLGTPVNGQALVYNGATSQWVPGTVSGGGGGGASVLNDLTDVTIASTPTNGQALVWNTATSQWIPGTVASGSIAINDLTDVNTTSNPPTQGQALIWDTDALSWIPGTVSGGGGTETIPFQISIYCSITGSDTTGDGTIGNPFSTLERASQAIQNLKCQDKIYIYLVGTSMFWGTVYTTLQNTYGIPIVIFGTESYPKPSLIWVDDTVNPLYLNDGDFTIYGVNFVTLSADHTLPYIEANNSKVSIERCVFGAQDIFDQSGRSFIEAYNCSHIKFSETHGWNDSTALLSSITIDKTNKVEIINCNLFKLFTLSTDEIPFSLTMIDQIYIRDSRFTYSGPYLSNDAPIMFILDCPNVIFDGSETGFDNCSAWALLLKHSKCIAHSVLEFVNCFGCIALYKNSSFTSGSYTVADGGHQQIVMVQGSDVSGGMALYGSYNSEFNINEIISMDYSSSYPSLGMVTNHSKIYINQGSSGYFSAPSNTITSNSSGPINFSSQLSYIYIPFFSAAGGGS